MSEGTPGRGPDADTRTDAGAGQGAANGRPPAPPVRYGPRNGNARNETTAPGGANGRPAGRTVPGSPQQYRAPQPGTNGNGSNGNGSNGNGANGSNGSSASGAPQAKGPEAPQPDGRGPASYSRPRPGAQPAGNGRQNEQDRAVADARTAAAARNASVAKGRNGSSATAAPAPMAADDTAVLPKVETVPTEDRAETAPADAPSSGPATTETPRSPGLRNLLRDRRPKSSSSAPAAAAGGAVVAAAGSSETAREGSTPDSSAPTSTEESSSEPTSATDTVESTQERTLTWRDRLGLPPKAPKPQPVDVPASGPGVPTAAAAAAVAATVAAGSAAPETKASPTGPTTAPDQTALRAPVTPASPAPVSTDTTVIPTVDAGEVAPSSPAAAATTQALVAAKPKVGLARRTRKARLRLSRVDPWSVMKTAFLFSIAAGIILVVATYGVWSVLNASGLFDAVNDMVKSVVSTPGDTTPFRIEEYVNTQKVLGLAAILAVIDVLIFTALATLGSFLYNLAATVLGGLEVTLAED